MEMDFLDDHHSEQRRQYRGHAHQGHHHGGKDRGRGRGGRSRHTHKQGHHHRGSHRGRGRGGRSRHEPWHEDLDNQNASPGDPPMGRGRGSRRGRRMRRRRGWQEEENEWQEMSDGNRMPPPVPDDPPQTPVLSSPFANGPISSPYNVSPLSSMEWEPGMNSGDSKIQQEEDEEEDLSVATALSLLEAQRVRDSASAVADSNGVAPGDGGELREDEDLLIARALSLMEARGVEVGVPAEAKTTEPNDTAVANECKICFESEIDTVLLPCAHMMGCFACSRQLQECPICRRRISKAQQVYKA